MIELKRFICLLCVFGLLSCKTLTKSVGFGASVGILTGAGLGGAIYWKDRKEAAILAGLGVGLVGAVAGYYLYKDQQRELDLSGKRIKEDEKNKYDNKISEYILNQKDVNVPSVIPKYVESRILGGKYIGGRVDWVISDSNKNLVPEKQNLIEEEKEDKDGK